MSEYIEVGQPLQFTDPNTPTRVGEIVESVSDIYNIPSPRLGMQVFVKSEKKSFVITSLKSKVINGVDVPEAAVEAFEAVGAKSITWNNDTDPSNMNDFTEAGVYDIKGDRTRVNDNLPILNTGGGHSFNARLTVLDSSISGSGKDDDKCITHVLSFSNRLGQGEVYIRTGKGSSLDNLTWEKWSTLQRNVNVGSLESKEDLRSYIDNGIYSGVFRYGSSNNDLRTFVMVVINDYAIGLSPRRVSQFLYSIDKATGKVSYETQTCEGETWKGWEILNKGEIDSMISVAVDNAIKSVIADAPEAFDTLKEIADWIANDETGAVALANAISKNSKSIADEQNRAESIEKQLRDDIEGVKNQVVAIDGINVAYQSDDIDIEFDTLGERIGNVTINAATTTSAGVMSALDKKELSKATTDIKTNAKAIEDEAERATGAEKTINAMMTEAAQAQATALAQATTTLSGAIAAEKTRAEGAEKANADAIAAEQERAKKAEAEIVAKIKNSDVTRDELEKGSIIVGQAREIHSRNGKNVTDSFLARTTAGSGTIGDGVATLKSVGGNIVKNLVDVTLLKSRGGKFVKNGNIITLNAPSTSEYSELYLSNITTSNHKYFLKVFVRLNGDGQVILSGYSGYKPVASTTITNNWLLLSGRASYESSTYTDYCIRLISTTTLSTLDVYNPICIDLTEMFGAGNEPDKATCDSLFGTMDALPQGLNFAKPTEFKSTGYNQADPSKVLVGKSIENGAIVDKVGSNVAVVPCLPCKIGAGENNGYCIHGAFDEGAEKVYFTPLNPREVEGELYICELTKDADKDTYVPQIKGYMLVEVPNATDLCVHFLWSEDRGRHDFEPYYESKVELPTIPEMSEWGLAGIHTSGTLACDEIDFVKGVYRKKIGVIDVDFFRKANLANISPNGGLVFEMQEKEGINNHISTGAYFRDTPANIYNAVQEKTIYIGKTGWFNANQTTVVIYDSTLKNKQDVINAFADVKIYYELAEPIEYPLPKVDNNYISSDYGVEQFDSAIPCNANSLYYMRSLAGETRNFLDRLMAGLGTSDATVVADRILAVVNPVVEPETPIEE